jgi:surface protein
MSYVDNSVPGLIVSFTDNTINLSGAPALEGTFDYSILVESTNLTYNQTSSTTLNGTITSNPPSLSTTLTSGPQSQTVTATTSITNVVYTFSTNYTGPVNAQASNLPPGISLSFSNNVATLSGTATTSGTYNYSITVSVGSTNSLVNGTITITPSPIYLENGICKCPSVSSGDTQVINGTTYKVVDNSTIAGQIANENYNLCTTLVTNMSSLFAGNSSFNSNIGFWDTSNVTTMGDLFQSADNFNQDISGWDVSNVTNMNNMFKYARSFNQNIGSWDVSSVTTMSVMFAPLALIALNAAWPGVSMKVIVCFSLVTT